MSYMWNWEVLAFQSPVQCSRCTTGMRASVSLGNKSWKSLAPTITLVGCSSLRIHVNGSPTTLKNPAVAWDYFKYTKSCLLAAEFTLKRTPFAQTQLWFWSHPVKIQRHFNRVILRKFPHISLQLASVYSLCSVHSDMRYPFILLSVSRKH